MFNRRTVLVLGAGASQPFGLPIGSELRDEICNLTEIPANPGIRVLRHLLQNNDEVIRDFQERFARSGLTIDTFVARQPDFDRTARLAIAACLSPKESDRRLFRTRPGGEGRPRMNGSFDWYQALWQLMLLDVGDRPDGLARNQLRVITFNYDRTFEHFLVQAIKSTFGTGDEDALGFASQFFPYHVYGQLGPYAGEGAVRFGLDPNTTGHPEEIGRAAEYLRLIPSSRPEADPAAKRTLEWAEQVFFLGFSYDSMNCRRLGLRDIYNEREHGPVRPPVTYGTALGHTPQECMEVREKIDPSANLNDYTCLEAMRHWRRTLTRP